MLLKEILKGFVPLETSDENIEIENLSTDSRKINKNCLFFCLSGENYDGNDFIEEALKNGAVCVVCEKKPIKKCNYVLVSDSRAALSFYSSAFFSNPQEKMKMIGVVGTNGKTSTCFIIKRIFETAGKSAAVIGTLGVVSKDLTIKSELTTPDPITLFSDLKALADNGVEYVAMEVSAHAIFYKKTSAIKFDAIAFTNCTQDHLDFFKAFPEYRAVKKSILNRKYTKCIIVNADDDLGREIALGTRRNVISYAIDNPSDVFAVGICENKSGIRYVLNAFDELYEIKSRLLGRFNIYNTLAAASVCKYFGIEIQDIALGIDSVEPIAGRMQKIASKKGADIYLDYAHTPDGLEKSLLTLRQMTKGSLICLFGCGGNRDKTKRAIMGRIAGDIADFVVLTSDNPRFEDASSIMKDIEFGLRESSLDYIDIVSRKNAIDYALRMLDSGDTLLIAGKGAEDYQEIMGVKHKFSDKEVVLELLNNE